jgi:hypothetical protein
MWDYLQSRYQQSSSALHYSLRQILHHLQQQNMSTKEYYAAFNKISSVEDLGSWEMQNIYMAGN